MALQIFTNQLHRSTAQVIMHSPGGPTSGLATERLCRSFGSEPAVVDLDLVVLPGEIHAIVGLNGAGKTTLMRLLLGMLRPDRGRALVLGCDVSRADRQVWRQVGHLIGAPFGYPELSVRETCVWRRACTV
jgi:ABC-2 type transport system ATP-binding protein